MAVLSEVEALADFAWNELGGRCHCQQCRPVAFSAGMRVDAVVPNFLAQEQVDACLGDRLLQEDWQVKDGHIELPTKPGLGFEINEKEAEQNRGIHE